MHDAQTWSGDDETPVPDTIRDDGDRPTLRWVRIVEAVTPPPATSWWGVEPSKRPPRCA